MGDPKALLLNALDAYDQYARTELAGDRKIDAEGAASMAAFAELREDVEYSQPAMRTWNKMLDKANRDKFLRLESTINLATADEAQEQLHQSRLDENAELLEKDRANSRMIWWIVGGFVGLIVLVAIIVGVLYATGKIGATTSFDADPGMLSPSVNGYAWLGDRGGGTGPWDGNLADAWPSGPIFKTAAQYVGLTPPSPMPMSQMLGGVGAATPAFSPLPSARMAADGQLLSLAATIPIAGVSGDSTSPYYGAAPGYGSYAPGHGSWFHTGMQGPRALSYRTPLASVENPNIQLYYRYENRG